MTKQVPKSTSRERRQRIKQYQRGIGCGNATAAPDHPWRTYGVPKAEAERQHAEEERRRRSEGQRYADRVLGELRRSDD